ncbi:MAG: tetratricopeptide repeat protein [Candidatus Omnitrophota bacterium]
MKAYKNIMFSAIIIIAIFGSAELVSRVFTSPSSYDYIERRIIEHNLTRHKKAREFRIFLYGESTMHGGALYPSSVIGKWLRLYLSDLLPEDVMRDITVVNFGRMGADSSFIANAFAETIPYKPDLAVFYTVHNDFCLVEYRLRYSSKKPLLHRIEDFFGAVPKRSALLSIFNRLMIRAKLERSRIRDARAAAEDPWYMESDSPEAFREDANLLRPGSLQFREVTRNFEKNVGRIIETARLHGIPVIFFEGLSRWKGYEPVRSIHGASVDKDALASWEGYFSEAEGLFAGKEYGKALELYGRCINIDPSYALTYYRAAECYERLGESDKANANYVLANDNDYFPIHAPSLVNRLYENIRMAGMKGVDVIQTQKVFEENSANGIVGDDLTVDQIHPSPEGQALMALEVVNILYKNNLLAPREKWRWDKLRDIDEMKKALGLDSKNMFHVYTGTASYLAKHYREAAKFLEKALAIKPGSVFVRSWLAWTYWKMGELDNAIALYRELYREKPSLASSFLGRHPDIKEALGGER